MNNPLHNPTDIALREALQGLAADIAHQHTPPPASAVWLRSQRRARERAIARATLPLRIMSVLGLLTAIAATAFVLHQPAGTPPADITSTRLILDLAAPALALVLAGCWLILRLDRTSNQSVS